MGLIYSSRDSEQVIKALSKNLASGKDVVAQLKEGSKKIIQAVDGRTLSGAAYTAGKDLFVNLVLPTIEKVTSACDAIEHELNRYQSTNSIVSGEGYLDEDILKQQIEAKKDMNTSIEKTVTIMNMIMKTSLIRALFDAAQDCKRELNQMSDVLQQDIEELQKKLEKLYEFNGQTKNLFTSSLDEMKLAMQGVLILNNTTVNSDGSYQLPAGIDKSWFTELKSEKQQTEMIEKERNAVIKELNELFEKNPAVAIEKIKNNDRLFGYVIGALDKFPEGLQNAALGIFIAQESWNELPKDVATKVLNSAKFATYISKTSIATQAIVYSGLIELNEKGWNVLAPIGYTTKVLSKTSEGAKIIAGSKVGFDLFKKLGPVSDFIKTHKVVLEGAVYVGDGLTITAYAYEEYINPKSPAYGDASKSVYGGLNVFLQNAGPLEGAQYTGPIGAVVGFVNYFGQGGGLSDVPLLNKIPFIKNGLIWIDEKHTFISETEKKEWLEKQYEIYDERKKHLAEGNIGEIKEDWLGQQKGRVDVGDFNNGLPKW
ncbi:TPA: T7SS effector LXG polymorphic toxin [Listeria innocua]